MLVLSRETGDAVDVGSEISVMVLAVNGNLAQSGVYPFPQVPIVRLGLRPRGEYTGDQEDHREEIDHADGDP